MTQRNLLTNEIKGKLWFRTNQMVISSLEMFCKDKSMEQPERRKTILRPKPPSDEKNTSQHITLFNQDYLF
jgi:hypothetical protein